MSLWRDKMAQVWIWASVLLLPLLIVLFLIMLGNQSADSIARFGWGFLLGTTWDPVHQIFGGLPFLFGTVVTSLFSLVMAGVIGLGAAVFLTFYSRGRVRSSLGVLIELLAAIPSVVYGLWGLYVLVPWLQGVGEPFLARNFGFLPFFRGASLGVGYLAGGLILSIMILPTITAMARDVLLAVPREIHEGALAIGATKFEVIRVISLPFARSGIIGALMLGFGRAVSETIAVTMVIGNRPQISSTMFAPGYTLASVIANEFTEATYQLYISALNEIGLVLLLLTALFYGVARLLVWRSTRGVGM
ncbi:MAG: phosphate ABC transporter permease subunit PstC [Bacilli bacterium]